MASNGPDIVPPGSTVGPLSKAGGSSLTQLRIAWLGLIAITFVASLKLPAWQRAGPSNPGASLSGLDALLGSLVGIYKLVGLVLPFCWSNPLLLIGCVLLACGRYRGAAVCGVVAALCGATVIPMYFWAGHVESGWYLWVGSMVALFVAGLHLSRRSGRDSPIKFPADELA